jgi:uncharacterized membrane protein YjgN (DUF898 family)
MIRGLKILLAICLAIGTIILFVTTVYRWSWDYNENGVHFSPDTMTTYNDGAIFAYGLLTILFLIPTAMLIINLKRAPRSQK